MKTIVPVVDSLPTSLPFHIDMLAGQIAPSTAAMYERDFRAYLAYAGTAEAALDVVTLRRWRAHLAAETPLSPNSINRMISAVKRIVKEAAAQGYMQHDEADRFAAVEGVKAAALKDRIKSNARTKIEPADMRAICELPDRSTAMGARDAALLATLASGALRVHELVAVQEKHIVRKGGYFILMVRGKNDVEAREAPLSREAAQRIEEWLTTRRRILDVRVAEQGTLVRANESAAKGDEYIFTAFDGNGDETLRITERALTTTAVWQIVRKYAKLAGLSDIKPHDFRRFVGTQLARKDIRQAQKALGHKRLETTARHYVLDELEPGLTETLYHEVPAFTPEGVF